MKENIKDSIRGVSVSESFYYHYDRLGSVRFISDSDGSVVCDYVYDAFGNLLISSGSLNQPYEYVGREGYYREEFGLYLLGVRWYDSSVGRFISRDPIGYVGGVNLYSYLRNNSINDTDPEGLGIIAAIKCWIYSKKIAKAREECEKEHCELVEKYKKGPLSYLAEIQADVEFMQKYGGMSYSAAMWNCVKVKANDEHIWEKWAIACFGAAGWPNKPWDPIPVP